MKNAKKLLTSLIICDGWGQVGETRRIEAFLRNRLASKICANGLQRFLPHNNLNSHHLGYCHSRGNNFKSGTLPRRHS